MSDLKVRIEQETRAAVRARARERAKALRLVNAALKQTEIDERRRLDDAGTLAVLAKMRKQRQDSLRQFQDAGREDLAAVERFEIAVIAEFMPKALSEEELRAAVASAISDCAATSMRDMGKVMGVLTERLAGRADMGAASRLARESLAG